MSQFSSFNPSDHPPNSSDDPLMDGLNGRADASIPSFASYQGSTNRAGLVDLPMSNPGQIPNLSEFRNGRDEPWNPLKATVGGPNLDLLSDTPQLNVSFFNTSHNYQNFGQYRDTAPLSEADTISPSIPKLPSDSGYGGSGTFFNLDSDHNAETRSLIFRYDQHVLHSRSLSVFSGDQPRRRRAPRSQRGGSTSSNPGVKCPLCEHRARTPSELKKHMARHSKPFKCDFPDCPRAKEGFGTHNDLDRHKICVHKVHMPDRVRYRCHVDGCKDGKKKWPRQDNFKQHLRRMHGMEEIEDISSFIYKSETEPEDAQSNAMSESTPSETGMSSIDAHSSIDVHSSWAELSLGLSGPGSSSDRTAGAATGVQSADLIQFSSSDHMMDDQSDFNLGDTTGLPGQTRSSFISDGLEMELAGLMDVSYRQDDRSISQDNHMDHQTFSASSTLSHTGTGMAMFSFGGGSEIQTHSPNILIQGDDTQLDGPHGVAQEFAHEDDYSQQHYKTEPLTPMCEDEMPTDEPVSYHDAENDYESEDAEADGDHDLTLSKMDEIQPINSQNVQSEIDSSLRTLFTSAAAFSPPSEGDHHSPGSIDLDTTEASALAALRALRDNPASIEKILQRLGYPTKPDETEFKEPTEIKDLSYLKEAKLEIPEVKTPAALSVAGEPTISKTIPCGKPGCDKVFWRQCELKKHHRRHDKPYACTFEKCDKRFGSKNDWKRHENSQHSQFEIWRCVEQVIISGTFNPTECGRVFHRRDSLQQHLERDHEIFDALQVERKLNEYRHGRNFESRFWCGFCVKTLEPQGGHVGPVHSERFDHIDRHFMGSHGYAKADISMWVGLDAEVVEIVDVGGVVDIVESRDKGKEVIVILDDDEVGDSSDKKRGSEEQEWGSRKSKKARKGVEGESPESGSASAERLWSCCQCQNYWSADFTSRCMDCNCNHVQCDSCV